MVCVSLDGRQSSIFKNIFKELKEDLDIVKINNGNLSWENRVYFKYITNCVRWKGNVAKDIGWEQFTDKVIVISEEKEKIVFVLWGSHAQSKIPLINAKHIIIKSPHPSPLSAHRGFFGSRPFSRINQNLEKNIVW